MILLGVVRGFRGATIVSIHIEDVRLESAGVVLSLRNEKTSRGNQPILTATPHSTNHELCLPCKVSSFLKTLGDLSITSGPLFRAVNRWGVIGDRALTTRSFRDIFQHGLQRAEIENARQFSPHSLRHGVVATGVAAGLPDADIMKITMHRSFKGFRAYRDAIEPWSRSFDQCVLDLEPETIVSHAGWSHPDAK